LERANHNIELAITAKSELDRIEPGLRRNWQQFALLVLVNAFVGAMAGMERTILPLLAERDFGIASRAVALSFLISFGASKALANLFAGRLSDRFGRRGILIVGWLIGLPVPLIIIAAPAWSWIVAANVLLGVNQGLCWSTTVIMKIDLAGTRQRGLAMGLNESAGYVAVSLASLLTGMLATSHGLRPVPFYPGFAFALLGLLLSLLFVRETHGHARAEGAGTFDTLSRSSFREVFLRTSWRDRTLFAASQAGLVNNLNDGVVWGLLPLILAARGAPLEQIAVVASAYPLVWGVGQLATGALSDRIGRKWMIVAGMLVQSLAIAYYLIGSGFAEWVAASALLGIGTALVYPTLLAAVSDAAHPAWRGSAIGVYRLWRDGGYVVGAVMAGLLADRFGMAVAIGSIACLTLLSGCVVAAVIPDIQQCLTFALLAHCVGLPPPKSSPEDGGGLEEYNVAVSRYVTLPSPPAHRPGFPTRSTSRRSC
jgi:MFS family permease